MTSKSKGYAFALLAITVFSCQDGISKHLGGLYPPVFVSMVRYWAFGLFAVLLAMRAPGGLKVTARSARPVLQVLRGLLLAFQIVLTIYCFDYIGLARSQAIFAATPLIVTLLSIVLLREAVGWRRWNAICIGLVGVMIILKPEGDFFDPKLLLAVLGCVTFGLYVIATRLASRTDTSATSFFYTGVVGMAVMSCIGPFFWTSMLPVDWAWMVLLCLTSVTSHYSLIRAYEFLDASAVQPLNYLSLVYASVIGVSVFGESLTLNMIIGSAIVVSAGIFTVWREASVARRGRRREY